MASAALRYDRYWELRFIEHNLLASAYYNRLPRNPLAPAYYSKLPHNLLAFAYYSKLPHNPSPPLSASHLLCSVPSTPHLC